MGATKMVFHHMVLIFHSFKVFSDLDLDMQVFQIWKTSRLPGSLLTEPSPILPFIIDLNVLVFNQMVLIFHLNISGSDFGRPMEILLGSLLKYNALEDFLEVV
ncbi:hypothetical protein DY000_02054103 [Brassica cretica]|uniref:Uncharacterized protein n=1 Tax=Brassica cretica TaxID=69181 RepID=A0ABQ7A5P2_BRACR|nr:hypothetical protein DY000_02054103 [Brassica cretica]